MPLYVDQLNREIVLGSVPQRIVSLVPSQTELLYDLGLREEVSGITKFCIHPGEWFRTKPRIGGTKKINFEKIVALNPDLIIGNKEENDQLQVEELMNRYAVWMSDIKNLDDAIVMIESVGQLVAKKNEALKISADIKSKFNTLKPQDFSEQPSVVYLIWKDPMITVGNDTFIHDMLSRCGLKNVFSHQTRYPELTKEELGALEPDLILLSSEPYPFKEKHRVEFQSLFPETKVLLADGEMFSWYGSRLSKAPEYFHSLIQKIH
jgi:ABC-type Fe3+-hydroxamate transport system substrate-binding protein